jgi:site-specific recombinase XerD
VPCYNLGCSGESSSGRTADSGCRTADSGYSPTNELVSNFLTSRRQGLSPKTIKFYEGYLRHSSCVIGLTVTGQHISRFLDSITCSNGGKHAYFRALRAFYTWLYSRKSGYGLNPQDNPILLVEPPKIGKRILPSLTSEQVDTLLDKAASLRDRCIISLLSDSGMRLSEMANIRPQDIDWASYTITIIGKGNKQRRAPFTERTANLLRNHLSNNGHSPHSIWSINEYGIQKMLKTLGQNTGIQCNPHSFRRGFACNLHRKGLSTLDIMHLGGWEDLSMVMRYTRSITFDDCLEHYRARRNSRIVLSYTCSVTFQDSMKFYKGVSAKLPSEPRRTVLLIDVFCVW